MPSTKFALQSLCIADYSVALSIYESLASFLPLSFGLEMHSEKSQINGHKHFFSKLVYVGTNLVLGNESVCKREVIQKLVIRWGFFKNQLLVAKGLLVEHEH